MWITRVSIANPVFATMMMVALLVLGLFSYARLNIDQYPDVTFPMVAVQTFYPGASPESVESDVTRPLEEQLNTVSGVKNVTSRSSEGASQIMVEFVLGTDSIAAAQDVRDKVALVRPSFRREVEEPRILRLNPEDQPIVSVALSSTTRSLRDLTTLADQVVTKRFESVRGVGQATIVGGVKREIRVLLRPAQLQALGVGVNQVIEALTRENQELPVGNLGTDRTETLVTVRGRIEDPRQFANLIVVQRGGAPVRLGDVADIEDGQEERTAAALVNGAPALSIDVVKVQGANTIEVANGVQAAVAELASALPGDVSVSIVRDSSVGIRNSVDDVKVTLIEGAVLTILIVFLFLNSWRSTVITGLTLPISLIGTALALYALGFTLNVMTLMALSLSIGILIDDAIVVRENIVRHIALGSDHHRAALEATQEIGLAVLATTFTIVAVFLPVAFMGGMIGQFFYEFGMTVSAAVLISLFVSFTLDPMLSSVWPDPHLHEPSSAARTRGFWHGVRGLHDRALAGIHTAYGRALHWALGHRKSVMAGAAVAFFGSFLLVPLIGTEFVPQPDLGESFVTIRTPIGSSLEYTEAKVRQAHRAIAEFPEVASTYATLNSGMSVGKNEAVIFVKLRDRHERERSQQQLQMPFRERLAAIGGVEIAIGMPQGPGGGKQIQVSVQGSDIEVLRQLSGTVVERMRANPALVDVDTSLDDARPALAIDIHRELASDLGVDVQTVGAALRPLVAGDAVTTWKAPDGENYDVTVRLPRSQREQSADLEKLALASRRLNADGSALMVPLRQIASLEPTSGAAQINRKNLHREVLVSANTSGRPAGDIGRELAAWIATVDLPPGYRMIMGGSTQDLNETAGYAAAALVLAVIFIYLILASQFGSFLQPVAIMASLPLSLIGVFLALLIARSTLNIFSIIGFIMLMGLVTKNAILLVDFINHGLASGLSRFDAVIEAGNVRLRPILMTTAAMIFGMLPLALGLGEGGEQRAPMAHAVIGGLVTSTLLTLVVVPVIYTYLDDFTAWARRALLRRPARSAGAGARALDGPTPALGRRS
jgi:hydrophobic/amphiphilic exporter-1 (mainly G- bacteria), HAE1 family